MMCAKITLFCVAPQSMRDNVQVEATQACFSAPNQVGAVNIPMKLSNEHFSLE